MNFKLLTSLTLAILNGLFISAQIPNASFEQWETVGNFQRPVQWITNQNVPPSPFEKIQWDTLAVDGNYALKMIPGAGNAFQGCESSVSVAAGLGAPVGADKALTFWVRTIPENPNASQDVYVRFGGTFFKSGNFAGNYDWQTTTRIDEFSKIAIPITDAETDSLVISIWGGSISSAVDACENRSFAWIDDIKIEAITRTHTNSFQPSDVLVYPNPSDGLIHIAPREQSFDYFQLLDAAGRVAMQGAFTPTLEIKIKGLFFLRLTNSRSGHSFTTPIAVY